MLQLCTIYGGANGTLGLNLSRAPWDPYPWVSGVQEGSNAQQSGVCLGDTLLELNGFDVLGLRISELATRLRDHWQSGANCVTMMMWRQQPSLGAAETEHAMQHEINQQSLQKFATCLQHIAQLLECPVCLEVVKPPGWQCCNGHVLCNNCRSRSIKCPVCRVPLGPRGRCLLSDKLFTLLAENFPCDRVKSQSNSEKKLKPDTTYYHQPKLAHSLLKLGRQSLQIREQCHKIKNEEATRAAESLDVNQVQQEQQDSTRLPTTDKQNNVNISRKEQLKGNSSGLEQCTIKCNSSRKVVCEPLTS
ncbi:uncharacterized protein LOC115621459 [Scaptodrosophila lebanonensis]|uniref:Uncharacterized protein LOC115621459 n=1 Tax=Drosophila lebanonensis TaxID=7225 RepID=A0A6J2T245_DROLE|nr:uncharacterized protein LOC115621459 [Scaptodrosophila lebanonensis]